jgi:uncharacterized protein
VTDTTDTLSLETVEALNLRLANYEMETGNEIAVAIISTTEDMPIAEYATEMGNYWRIGKKAVDNGAILLIALDDRKLFLAAGRQLEGALTDLESSQIIDEIISPRFKTGNFEDGISAGIDGIFSAIAGESFTELRTEETNENSAGGTINAIFIVIFFVFPWLAAILGRSKKIWPGGAIGALGGGIAGAIFLSGFLILGAAIALGALGLLFDFAVSRNYAAAKKSGRNVAWWAGGNRGGLGGKGGFGGFGGGGFSGGGAGGSW